MKKILLVEENIYLRDMYTEALTDNDFYVINAEDTEQVLEKIKGEQFDLIMIDILLAKHNDMEILKKLKKDDSVFKNIPVYLLSNLGDDTILREALDFGAEGYISKERIKPHQLVQQIKDFFSSIESV